MHRSSMRRLTVAFGAAAVLAGAAVAISASSGAPREARPSVVPALFRGIPEREGVLGDPAAPVTLTEFVDLQCPVCAQAAHDLLPAVIEEYVRPGKVRLELRTLHFLGPDSERAARMAHGAAAQNRLWPFVHAFYSAQGAENSGFVTDGFLREVARAAGVDAQAALGAADDAGGALAQANSAAAEYGVTATPTFLLEPRDGPAQMLGSGVPSMADLRSALDEALGR